MKPQTQQPSFSEVYVEERAKKTGNKPKIYQLGISKVYLKGHPKAGKPTHFRSKIQSAILDCIPTASGGLMPTTLGKIHTFRHNYDYWKGVEEKVNSGKGVLSLREWEGAPYNSKRPEFLLLGKMRVDFAVIETKGFGKGSASVTVHINGKDHTAQLDLIAQNDGLENGLDLIQWLGWDGFDGALINFTEHAY